MVMLVTPDLPSEKASNEGGDPADVAVAVGVDVAVAVGVGVDVAVDVGVAVGVEVLVGVGVGVEQSIGGEAASALISAGLRTRLYRRRSSIRPSKY